MLHQVSNYTEENTVERLSSKKVEVDHMSYLDNVVNQLYYDYTKITPEFIKSTVHNENYYFDSMEALKLGLIDKIIITNSSNQ